MKNFYLSLIFVSYVFSLSGCSSVTNYIFEEEDVEFVEELTIIASPRMNGRSPLRLDVVVNKNPKLTDQISSLTARQYMKQRHQIKRDHPQEIQIHSFELIPGTSIIMSLSHLKKHVDTVFIFADFHNKKANRWKVPPSECIDVEILESSLNLKPHKWEDRKNQKQAPPANDIIILEK